MAYLGAQILRPIGIDAIKDEAFSLNILWDQLVAQGRAYPLAAFLDRALRKPDGREGRQPVRDVGLDVDQIGVDAEHGCGKDACNHGRTTGGLDITR